MCETELRRYQFLLRRAGYTPMLSGELDKRTSQSLKAFQSDIRLPISGTFCEKTKEKLERYAD